MVTEKLILDLEKLRDKYQEFVDSLNATLKVMYKLDGPQHKSKKSSVVGQYSGMTQKEGCYAVLGQNPDPMTKQEIYEEFTRFGGKAVSVGSISVALSRNELITTDNKGKWFIKWKEKPEEKLIPSGSL